MMMDYPADDQDHQPQYEEEGQPEDYGHEGEGEDMMHAEGEEYDDGMDIDAPVTQEDAWAVIRYVHRRLAKCMYLKLFVRGRPICMLFSAHTP